MLPNFGYAFLFFSFINVHFTLSYYLLYAHSALSVRPLSRGSLLGAEKIAEINFSVTINMWVFPRITNYYFVITDYIPTTMSTEQKLIIGVR